MNEDFLSIEATQRSERERERERNRRAFADSNMSRRPGWWRRNIWRVIAVLALIEAFSFFWWVA